jgi:hypothetical protein
VIAARRRFRRACIAAVAGLLLVPAAGAGDGLFSSPSRFLGTVTLADEDLYPSTQRRPLAGPKADCVSEEDFWTRYWPRTAPAWPSWSVVDRDAQRAVEHLHAWEASGLIARTDATNHPVSLGTMRTDDGGGVGLCFRW